MVPARNEVQRYVARGAASDAQSNVVPRHAWYLGCVRGDMMSEVLVGVRWFRSWVSKLRGWYGDIITMLRSMNDIVGRGFPRLLGVRRADCFHPLPLRLEAPPNEPISVVNGFSILSFADTVTVPSSPTVVSWAVDVEAAPLTVVVGAGG